MKFPSLSNLAFDAARTFRRFPSSITSAVIATSISVYLVEIEQFEEQLTLVNLLLTAALGIPLFFCIRVFVAQKQLSQKSRIGLEMVGLIILGLIFWSFPNELTFDSTRVPYIRYLIYNLTLHLCVAILPFLKESNQLSFWNYNKVLFLRLTLGALYSAIIFLGIVFALLAISTLFDVEYDPQLFAQLFFTTVGVFNTWFFLAGIPLEFKTEASPEDVPNGLRVFTQFVLIPLLLIYLLILYAYGAKIIITWDWPRGIVSYMIIAISVLGIFTNLLLFPYQELKETGWIKLFYKAFYFLLFPLIILLFIAIGIRIEDYGLTVNRYIIALLGIWLTFLAVYFTFGKKNIKVIPLSLALFMIFSSFGPWGMFGLSRRDQMDRLSHLLEENGLLVQGKIQTEVQWKITEKGGIKAFEKVREINLERTTLNNLNSIVQYLHDYHGLESLQPWFEQDLKSIMNASANKSKLKTSSMEWDELVVESMGLKFVPEYELITKSNEVRNLNFNSAGEFNYPIADYEQLMRIDLNRYTKKAEKDALRFQIDPEDESTLILEFNEKENRIELAEFVEELEMRYTNSYNTVPWEDLQLEFENKEIKLLFFFENIDARIDEKALILESVKGIVLIQKRSPTE